MSIDKIMLNIDPEVRVAIAASIGKRSVCSSHSIFWERAASEPVDTPLSSLPIHPFENSLSTTNS
jgi:hypothetical protein